MTTGKANSAEKNRHDTKHISVEIQPSRKIQKVPLLLRNNASHSKCYDPIVVSIGPYHHGKPEFKELDGLKPRMKDKFVKDSNKTEDQFEQKMVQVASKARECYAEGSIDKSINDEQFKEMMLLDGCFILQFIHCLVDNKYDELEMKHHIVAYVQRDMLLLENQLPFIVLEELMSLRYEKPDDAKKKIHDFIKNCRCLPEDKSEIQGQFERLIDMVRQCIKLRKNSEGPEVKSDSEGPIVHLIDLMVRQLIEPNAFTKNSQADYWFSYRSAKELTSVGIHLKRGKKFRFTDVYFNSNPFMGTLTLPPIAVDDSTKAKLLNMVAYETCPDSPNDCGVTSYICFLDSLIDKAEDVKELRSKGIVFNILGSDDHVAQLFNEITHDLVPNPDAFLKVKRQIDEHCNNRVKLWIAVWIHEHFTTPWTVLGFLGAIFAIILSVIQAYFAAFPRSNDKHK